MRWMQSAACAALVIVFLGATSSHARDGWDALLKPGTHALMRHAQAPGTGDPDQFRLGDCKTQRNLDDRGRMQARATGAEIRAKGVRFSRVLSSQWCRTLETARLLDVGAVEEEPALNSFFADTSTEAARTAAIVARLRALPASEKTLLVTHQVNITALTGVMPRSGEITVVSVNQQGVIEVEGRIDAQALR